MTKINFGLVIGDVCQLKHNPNYAIIREIGYFGKSYKIAKCEWSQQNPITMDIKFGLFGIIKYFKLSELKKLK